MAEPAARFTLISAARLLDGRGGSPIGPAALLIEGERVADLGRSADVHPPAGASVERRDYGAATILPGLVDAHTHLVAPGDGTLGDDIAREDDDILLLQAAKNARTLLHSGVTTLRENGAKGKVAFSLREGIRRRLAPGPRMVVCGRPIAITGGHMGYFGSEADGEAAVRAMLIEQWRQLPGLSFEAAAIFHGLNGVAVETRTRGTSPLGREVDMLSVNLFGFDGPDLVLERCYFDRMTVAESMGYNAAPDDRGSAG